MGSPPQHITIGSKMHLSVLVLVCILSLTLSMPSSEEGHLKMRYGSANRNCPIRGKTTKKGLVRPEQCSELKGKSKWVTSWQRCGAMCTRNRYYRFGLTRVVSAHCTITPRRNVASHSMTLDPSQDTLDARLNICSLRYKSVDTAVASTLGLELGL